MTGAAQNLISRMLQRKAHAEPAADAGLCSRVPGGSPQGGIAVDPALVSFEKHPALVSLRLLATAAKRLGIGDPFFRVHEGMGGHRTRISGRDCCNFSHYNYLGLNGHPEVLAAAREALERYGTSVGASRLVAGERPVQRELERALATLYGADDCVAFVSGHATNVSTIGALFGPKDIIFHDSLIHNSVIEGVRLSGAARCPFPHNDLEALEGLLASRRVRHERALVVVEGLYSMDGDIPDLPRLVDLKRRYGAFLMVDEAHALGVLGAAGRGLAEYWGVPCGDVDIWMGTLSKTLAGCGGYIAGSQALVDILKYHAPGFVYSVGLAPVLAAASLKALEIMLREPERVAQLRARGKLFLELARQAGLDTGLSSGLAVIPVITGSSRKAVALSNTLFARGVNVQPIIHPAVEEKAARLRFFISSEHTEDEIRNACNLLAQAAHGEACDGAA